MLVLEVLFWLAAAVIVYTYLGYGMTVWLLVELKQAFGGTDDGL